MERIAGIASHLTQSASTIKPVRVTITGAAGNIGYALVFMIAGGRLLGPDQPIDIVLLEIPPAESALQGVVMELRDAAMPLINSITATVDQAQGFKDTDVSHRHLSRDCSPANLPDRSSCRSQTQRKGHGQKGPPPTERSHLQEPG